jgi:CRP/FNR family transcriptional regulator, cyclic AMP receptor protein
MYSYMSRLEDHIAEYDMFEGLTEADVALFGDRLSHASFAKGELVYSPFDAGDAVYLVTQGRVCLYRSGADGRQFTLAMVDSGSAFGHVALLHAPTYDAYAEAMTETEVAVLRVDDLERVVADHPQVAVNLLRALAERLHEAEDQLEALAFHGVATRLAAKLLELMDRYGRVTPHGIRIDERFTHMQLAEMIGTSRETLTKVINELRDTGLIDVRDRMVWVLDVDGLERLRRRA